MRCEQFGWDLDGSCVWCDRPALAHREVECPWCDGWGFVRGFDEEPLPCPTSVAGWSGVRCVDGAIVGADWADSVLREVG
jgi:hypothetical protein